MNLVWIIGLLLGVLLPGLSDSTRALIAIATGTIYIGTSLGIVLSHVARLRKGRRDRSLSDHCKDEEEFAVEIRIEVGGKAIGIDRGVVWFEEALLGFSGRCTSFLLSATDLVPPGGIVLSDFDAPYLPLKVRSGGRSGAVILRPLFGSRRSFRRRLKAFLRARVASDAARQWPPLTSYDGLKPELGTMVDEYASQKLSP